MAVQYAARLAMIAFATANLQGMLSNSELVGTIQNGLLAAGLFFVLGYLIGNLAQKVVEESVEKELRETFQHLPTQEPTSSNS